MAKTVAAAPLEALSSRAEKIEKMKADLKAEYRARNRDVVAAVDNGYGQDAVARAIRRSWTAVTKILAGSGDLIEDT